MAVGRALRHRRVPTEPANPPSLLTLLRSATPRLTLRSRPPNSCSLDGSVRRVSSVVCPRSPSRHDDGSDGHVFAQPRRVGGQDGTRRRVRRLEDGAGPVAVCRHSRRQLRIRLGVSVPRRGRWNGVRVVVCDQRGGELSATSHDQVDIR